MPKALRVFIISLRSLQKAALKNYWKTTKTIYVPAKQD